MIPTHSSHPRLRLRLLTRAGIACYSLILSANVLSPAPAEATRVASVTHNEGETARAGSSSHTDALVGRSFIVDGTDSRRTLTLVVVEGFGIDGRSSSTTTAASDKKWIAFSLSPLASGSGFAPLLTAPGEMGRRGPRGIWSPNGDGVADANRPPRNLMMKKMMMPMPGEGGGVGKGMTMMMKSTKGKRSSKSASKSAASCPGILDCTNPFPNVDFCTSITCIGQVPDLLSFCSIDLQGQSRCFLSGVCEPSCINNSDCDFVFPGAECVDVAANCCQGEAGDNQTPVRACLLPCGLTFPTLPPALARSAPVVAAPPSLIPMMTPTASAAPTGAPSSPSAT